MLEIDGRILAGMDPVTDKWGVALTTHNLGAAQSFEQGVDALASLDGEPLARALEASEQDSDFVLARCLAAYVKLYGMTGASRREAAKFLNGLSLNDNRDFRTQQHFLAATKWMTGDLPGAIADLESVLLAYPKDLFAAKIVQDLYLFIGDSVNLRDCVNRIFMSWSGEMPGYSHLLGMRSFGLEENYSFDEADALGREALVEHPRNVYARHSVAHVYEMTGERVLGIEHLTTSVPDWQESFSNIHMWWHLALMYIDEGRFDDANDVYDRFMCGTRPTTMHDVGDRASYLWRLHLLGQDVTLRASDISRDAQQYIGDSTYGFNEAHLVMSELLNGKPANARKIIEFMKERESDSFESRVLGEVAIPFCEGLLHFANGEYAVAASIIASMRHSAYRLGGSHAQCDIVFLSAIAAAAAADDLALTRSLRAERLLTRPNSQVPTDRLIEASRARK